MTEPATSSAAVRLPDAAPDNWVDRWAPGPIVPYLHLARLDRPIGAWLLLFPCWWSQSLAELSRGAAYPDPVYLALFLVGAFVMRGAGCTWNDIVDRDYDAAVERTAGRPIPSGRVKVGQALVFGVALSLIGLAVLVQFNQATIWLAIASLGLVAIYPFMKRLTFWPQLVLGLTFKWGALVGWTAVTGALAPPAIALYAGAVLWTIGYDTIYAHQDKADDLTAGLKSTAIRFGEDSAQWVGGFYAGAWIAWAVAGWLAGTHLVFFIALALIGLQLAWQVTTLDTGDARGCLRRFRSNRHVGWALFLGIVIDMALTAVTGRS